MQDLDETDLEILRLLVEDARRPFSEIADKVGVSPPTVSDRVDRVQDLGVIEQFTLDVDQSKLVDGVDVLVDVDVRADGREEVRDRLCTLDAVEHVFATADGTVVCTATLDQDHVAEVFGDALDVESVRNYDVKLLSGSDWNPRVTGTAFALECAECGNTVTNEGVSDRIGGDLYHFCCPSCHASFEEQYEELAEAAEAR